MRSVNTLLLASFAGNTLALNIHRHDHKHWARDAVTSVHWVTVHETVTVYGSSKPTDEPYYKHLIPSAGIEVVAPKPTAEAAPAPAPEEEPVQAPPEVEAPPSAGAERATEGSPSYTSNKRGFAYNDANLVNSLVSSGTSGSWAYNWDSTDGGLSGDIEFVPMLWSDRSDHLSRWTSNVEAMLDRGSTNILSFNEPDHPEQASLSPGAAAAAHAKHLNPYGSRARIGAPAVTNSNIAGQGTEWLEAFIPACKEQGCQIDFCVAHWYSPHDAEQSLVDHLTRVHELCDKKPVWLTEFAPQGDEEQTRKFLSNTLKTLDDLPFLERYSYFMVGVGSLLSSENTLSSSGQAYFGQAS